MKTRLTLLLIFLFSVHAYAQEILVSGTVVSAEDNIPVPGVSVIVTGTSRGVSTDFDGNYSIKVQSGEVLEFSFLGFKSQSVTITNQTTVNISLQPDIAALDEVVVVGYGTQKRADLTSAIVTIEPEELQKVQASQVVQGFQGQVAGVQISSLGSPGDTPEINIRGINSLFGNSAPLFVVDGMFYNNIDFLNASEIQDLSILKDASAAAIYGVRAANGVVLITTKGGKFNRDAQIEYTTNYGIQRAQNILKMANAEQFTTFALESGSASEIASIDDAFQRFGRSRVNPNIPNVNTDWYKEVLREAPMYSHDLQINGGTESIAYSVGGNYLLQKGILDMKNDYKRFNLRARIDAKVNNWLKVGANFLNSRAIKYDDESSAWQLTYYAVPILPVFDSNFTDADPLPYADAREIGYRGSQNPFPLLDNSDRRGERRRSTINIYTDISLIPEKLNFKTTLSYNNRNNNERIVLLPYFVSDNFQRTIEQSSITRNNSVQENYILDNVLTYSNTLGDHDFTLMAGTSYRDDYFRSFGTRGNFDPGAAFVRNNDKTWYISNTAEDSRISYDGGSVAYGFSYFGRASYKFQDKYIAYATFRAEGSNKYEETYVYLPAFGLGWVASEESFMKGTEFIDFLKFRAGWGRLANDAVPASIPQSANTISTVFDDTLINGFSFSTNADDLGWEFTEEANVGLTAKLFDNSLSLEADYFIKDTKNLAIPVLPLVGTDVSQQNVGSVRNKGFEIAATYKGKITEDLGFTVSGNFSSIDNEITDLEGQPHIDRGSAEFRQRLAVGQPINVFYGWQTDGVYQTPEEIAADPLAQAAIAEGIEIKPGYFKYKDLEPDGLLDANDRTYIGAPVPTYYYGGNLGLNYKNWEVSAQFYGQGGNVILNRNRAEVIRTQGRNIDAELAINRWHGEGTTNAFPSSEGYRQLWNQRMSGFWLEKGDFFRIQNIQLAYTLKHNNLPEMRFTLTADRPFQWASSFNGFNPEVGFDGIDLRTYPVPAVYSFGLNVKL
ncbi:SusC/RagA family TonB-linked outer membrane protein [Hwangdonia lutea]|uniref:TonB-dependent receptor n=1 Tax=Hwangdonia lutea TaxID=3075823 RepID=A0AA97HRZ3_9FLAO|nr:TonB-dependent receptor [Hwangdonia sp. SCSIO 19198]WOD45182.1 TonB-dependent receptor [Hwangdonia sp. SCSIO 19198]